MQVINDLWNKESHIVTFETDELNWYYGDNSYFTVNTDATNALVGFAPNKKVELGDWQIETENPFAVIFVSDLSKKGNLSSADKILVTAIACGRNTGMEYEYSGNETVLKSTGEMPLLLEPVVASISSQKIEDCEVRVLDQDGRLTQNSIPLTNGVFKIDGAKDKTLYYLIIKK